MKKTFSFLFCAQFLKNTSSQEGLDYEETNQKKGCDQTRKLTAPVQPVEK